MGLDGVPLDEARKKATGVGTIVHAIIEADARGLPAPDHSALEQTERDQVDQAMHAWRRWRERYKFEVLAAECSLTDDELIYGGTLDMAWVEGHVSLVDWKAANGLYPENLCQLSGYGHLWNKHNPDKRIEEFHIIRLGKEDASFHHHSWPAVSLQPAWQAFVHCRRLYDLDRELRRKL